ncbi:hypothetical protein GALMADRAFT_53171 [Galerina marginata CBS 339.88]|uniref:Uncharacterized protein n=1 Tax=Galerina marginata (strain CBS 339.88) TaxID=685588 RepID=A0A067U145_GALM3|nr:hypothetical protein GALMADRAFT_53171 [Galerina marginata CBS 339.88]
MLSLSKRRAPLSLTGVSLVLVALSFVVKLIGTLWVKQQISSLTREYSYVGNDYPEVWPIERETVLMTFDNPKHFRLEEEDGIAEWAALAPQNGVVHLGPSRRPFTVAMIHQLKCLDIIREEMVRDHGIDYAGPSVLARHCLNYVRQMVMCHGDLELESFQFASHKNPIDWHGVYECKDWEAVYNGVKQNQAEHAEWLKQRDSV